MSRLEVFVLVATAINVAIVLEFVRRRKLLESFAMLWLAVGVGLVVLAIGRPLLDRLADAVGVAYGPTLIFAVGILFLLFVTMSLSLHVSQLEERVEILAEEIAFLRGINEPQR